MGNANCCTVSNNLKDKELSSRSPQLSKRNEEEGFNPEETPQGHEDIQKSKKKKKKQAAAPSSKEDDQPQEAKNGSTHDENSPEPLKEMDNFKQVINYDANANKTSNQTAGLTVENNRVFPGIDPANPLKEVTEELEESSALEKGGDSQEKTGEKPAENKKEDNNLLIQHAPSSKHAKQLQATPPERLKILDEVKLSPFVFDLEELENGDLPFLGPYLMNDSGAVYRGQFKDQKRHGKGEQFFANGAYYIGYWMNDVAHGKGRLIHADKSYYEGGWLNDKAHGNGVFIAANGSKYEGAWYQDTKHGKGSETWADGTSYEGEYKNGKKHGTGVFKWADGGVYKGKFADDDICGYGEYLWADGKAFKGTWRNNKMDGSGEFTWPDGKRYIGEYVEDQKQGYGEFYWPDGRIYKGSWANGKQHGTGTFTDNKGREKKGEWEDGKHLRWI